MAKTVEELLQENNDLLRGVMSRSGSGGAAGSGGSNAGAAGQWMSTLNTGVGNTMGALTKFTQGTYGAADAVTNFKQIAGAIGPVGKISSEVVGQVAEAGMGINKSLNAASQSGAYFGNNLGLYDKAVLSARMSLPEFEAQMKSSSQSIAGLGANMDKSALAYLNTAKKVQETDLAYQLQATGMDSSEFGKVLTLVAHNSKMADMSRASVQQTMIASTLALATEMDNTARLTGISRQEQQESLERKMKSKDMELMLLALGPEQAAAITESVAQTRKYGDSVSEAVKIYATGGPQNADEQQKIVALGPEMADAARRLSEVKGNTKEDEAKREAIIKEMDMIAARKAADKDQIDQMVRLYKSGDAQAKLMAESYLQQANLGATITKQNQEAAKAGLTREQYLKQEQDKLAAARQAAATGSAAGPEGAGAVPASVMNKGDRFLKDVQAGAGEYFNKLNTEVGGATAKFTKLNEVLRPWTSEAMASAPDKIVQKVKEQTGAKTISPENIPESERKRVNRQDGSFGSVGKLIEDFGAGTPAMLHGKEGVVTENQLKGIISSVQKSSEGIDPAAIEKQLGGMAAKIKSTMESSGIEKQLGTMANQIKTTIDKSGINKQMEATASKVKGKADNVSIEQLLGTITSQAGANSAKVNGGGINLEKQFGSMFGGVQTGLKNDLEKAKTMTPTTDTFEKMFSQFKPADTKPAAEPTAAPVSEGTAPTTDASSELVKGIEQLNKRMERLISAVEEGANSNVKAIKSNGNMIA